MPLGKNDIKAMIAILSNALDNDEDDIEEVEEVVAPKKRTTKKAAKKTSKKATPKTKNNKIKTRKSPVQKSGFVNEFESMPEFHMHKEDTQIDKKLWSKLKPTKRKEKYTPVNVRCRVCGKEEDVNPAILINNNKEGRYKCNDCSSSPG